MTDDLTSDVTGFFPDADASSVASLLPTTVIVPIIKGQAFDNDELSAGGGIRVISFIIDASPSMEIVATEVREGFNIEFVPAVLAARSDEVGALRVGGSVFSDTVTQIWRNQAGEYYHPLDQLPKLTINDYNPDQGWGTALHQAILDETRRVVYYATQLQNDLGVDVEVDLIIVTDGANNQSPRDPQQVRDLIQGRDKSRVRYAFLYFETLDGIANPRDYAVRDLGIDSEMVMAFMAMPGESVADRRKRFRRLIGVLSRVSAARGVSVVVAAQDETEII